MIRYQHVLAAVDLSEEAPLVLEHAQQIANEHKAQLSIMTVVRPITYAGAGLWASREMADFDIHSERVSKEKLAVLAKKKGIGKANTYVVLGVPAASIKAQAQALDADLIVLGTRSRNGLHQMLGSTANGVLQGADSDVLAVSIDTETPSKQEVA